MGFVGGKILVIDDEAGARETLRMILKVTYNVVFAENAEQARVLLEEQDFDLITLDLRLPDARGVDLLKEIKHLRPDVEVIIITGFGDLNSSMEAIKSGAFSYLLKPFNIGEVLSQVNHAVEKKKHIDLLKDFLIDIGEILDLKSGVDEGIRKLKEDKSILNRVKNLFKRSEEEVAYQKRVNHFDFIRILIETTEKDDPYASGHTSRVNYFCSLVGRRLELTDKEQDELQFGAYLHDIGKLGIDQSVVRKRDKYTPEEAEMIKKHTKIGIALVSPLALSKNIIAAIEHHHEFYNGGGYTEGLKAKELPLIARIVTVADAFDGMTSDYPYKYRKALSLGEAVEELEKYSGSQFDPDVVTALIQAIEKDKGKILLKSSMISSI